MTDFETKIWREHDDASARKKVLVGTIYGTGMLVACLVRRKILYFVVIIIEQQSTD